MYGITLPALSEMQEESFHTQLASSYLRQLIGLREETSAPDRELKRARYNPTCGTIICMKMYVGMSHHVKEGEQEDAYTETESQS